MSVLVSVGIPTFNNSQGLYQTLKCITEQTYTNLEIIVSDNASTDPDVAKVLSDISFKDSRIKVTHQKHNIGASKNFQYVFEQAHGEYFMWAADDDLWDKNFIEKGLECLLSSPEYKMWFCTIENIDTYNRLIRTYKGFSRFTSGNRKWLDILKYLIEPEILGKANMIYGIFKKNALENVINQYFINESWGSDYCFNLAFLIRYDIVLSDDVLLKKRVLRVDDKQNISPIIIKYPSRHIFPIKESVNYTMEQLYASKSTKYWMLILIVMFFRFFIALKNTIYLYTNKIFYRLYYLLRKK